MIWITVIVFIVLLLLLVLAHEWGHFITAKRAGCRVEEFGFGFPPRLFSIKRGETRYSFNLFPIGGFVKIEGEDMQDDNPGPRNFASKSPGQRTVILSAGVAMNVVLAYLLLTFQAGVGYPTLLTAENAQELVDSKTYILAVDEGSPAQQAGLKDFDRIVTLQGEMDPIIERVQQLVGENKGQEVVIEVERQGTHEEFIMVPRIDPPEGEGALGISLASTGLKKEPLWKTPFVGLKRTGDMLVAIFTQFYFIIQRIFAQGSVGDTLTGPIGIAIYTNEATQLGMSYLLEFGALISLNLALINILPFPALDGGRIVFIAIEKIRGKRLPEKYEQITHSIGFVLLLALMFLITWRDIIRFF